MFRNDQKSILVEAYHTLKDSILFKTMKFKARELTPSGSDLQRMHGI